MVVSNNVTPNENNFTLLSFKSQHNEATPEFTRMIVTPISCVNEMSVATVTRIGLQTFVFAASN